jgi:hypothetical protein
MSALSHTLAIMLSLGLAYLWLHIPALNNYSLQAFAIGMVAYLIIKKLTKAKVWHLGPSSASLEMPVITFSFLLLIGATGNFNSVFFPLSYIHLFFLVMSAQMSTSLIITSLIMLFHWGMTPDLNQLAISNLVSLPLLMIFFLFTKQQYTQVATDQKIFHSEKALIDQINAIDSSINSFFENFLKAKLDYLQELTEHPQENQATLQGQLTLLKIEVEKIIAQLSTWRRTPPPTS